jgi:hypothetical protein
MKAELTLAAEGKEIASDAEVLRLAGKNPPNGMARKESF